MPVTTSPILVGVHPRRHDSEPLALASLLAELTGARVIALCSYAHDSIRPEGAELERALRDEAIAALERSAAELPPGVTTWAIPSESPAQALLEAAESARAGLLVVGSAHGGPLGRLAAGSVADRILHGAPCPVAIAPRGYAPPSGGVRRVGAAFVDRPEGRDALDAAAALAGRAGAHMEAITVVDWFEPTGLVEPAPELIEHERRLATELARAAVRDALGPVVPTLSIEAVVLPGRPAATLVERSQRLDLLVCGSRGYGPLKAVVLGSVSRALAHHGHCPLIVVPRHSVESMPTLINDSARLPNGTVVRICAPRAGDQDDLERLLASPDAISAGELRVQDSESGDVLVAIGYWETRIVAHAAWRRVPGARATAAVTVAREFADTPLAGHMFARLAQLADAALIPTLAVAPLSPDHRLAPLLRDVFGGERVAGGVEFRTDDWHVALARVDGRLARAVEGRPSDARSRGRDAHPRPSTRPRSRAS